MNEQILFTIVRGTSAYLLALFLTRIMGRKLISSMTFFDFIVAVSIGSITANLAIGPQSNEITTSTALLCLSVLVLVTDFLHIKSMRIQKLVNSEPVTVIDNGSIVEGNLRKLRLTINELNMKLREKNMFSLADVEFAILEPDGQLSVLPKANKAPLTPSQANITAVSPGLMKDIIIDGVVLEENLRSSGLDTSWLMSQLGSRGLGKPEEVFYAGVDSLKNLYISVKNSGSLESHGKYGIE